MKKLFLHLTRPLVHAIAHAYGLRVNLPVHGQNPLVIHGDRKAQIPASVYFNTRSGSITVGRNTVFGEDAMVLTGKHQGLDHAVPESGRDITIGANCYIGSGAILIGPLTVGEGAIIGAGAVVTKDVEAQTFVAGNPAKLIRRLNAQR